MKEKFEEWRPGKAAMTDVSRANDIVTEYRAQGFTLTLRQLYYQMVSRDMIPNTIKSYKRIVEIMTKARMAGMLDWSALEDRGRNYILPNHWNSPAEIIRASAQQYREYKWRDQPNHVEVMVEKQALEGILLPVCRAMDIGFTANKGYSSVSALYEAAQRMKHAAEVEDKQIHVLYLGDHDPSGIDMTRDIRDRLTVFMGIEFEENGQRYINSENEIEFETNRLALNMDQVRSYDPPENPAKMTDSRAEGYIHRFGRSSWELDALNPTILASLVREAVLGLRDDDLWDVAMAKENVARTELTEFADEYDRTH